MKLCTIDRAFSHCGIHSNYVFIITSLVIAILFAVVVLTAFNVHTVPIAAENIYNNHRPLY